MRFRIDRIKVPSLVMNHKKLPVTSIRHETSHVCLYQVVTLTVAWWNTYVDGTEHFSTFVDGKEVGTNPNLEMHIMELRQGEAASLYFTVSFSNTHRGGTISRVSEIRRWRGSDFIALKS